MCVFDDSALASAVVSSVEVCKLEIAAKRRMFVATVRWKRLDALISETMQVHTRY